MKRTLSQPEYLDIELERIGVYAHITHLKQLPESYYSFITVATPRFMSYSDLHLALAKIYNEAQSFRIKGSDLDRLIVKRFSEQGFGVSPCHSVDQFNRKRGNIISMGRLLKLTRAMRAKQCI